MRALYANVLAVHNMKDLVTQMARATDFGHEKIPTSPLTVHALLNRFYSAIVYLKKRRQIGLDWPLIMLGMKLPWQTNMRLLSQGQGLSADGVYLLGGHFFREVGFPVSPPLGTRGL